MGPTRTLMVIGLIGLAHCTARPPTTTGGPVGGGATDFAPSLLGAGVTDGQPAPDLATLRAAVRARPNDVVARTALAEGLQAAGALPEALVEIDRALAIGPATPERLRLQGRLALRQRDPAKAEAAYRAANIAEPGRIDTLTGYGVALGLLGRFTEAQVPLRAALDQRPTDWVLRGNLAFALVNANEATSAVAVLVEAETDSSAPRSARHNLGLALVAAGQQDRAERVLRLDMGRVEAVELANAFARYVEGIRQRPAVPGAGAALPQENRPDGAHQLAAARPELIEAGSVGRPGSVAEAAVPALASLPLASLALAREAPLGAPAPIAADRHESVEAGSVGRYAVVGGAASASLASMAPVAAIPAFARRPEAPVLPAMFAVGPSGAPLLHRAALTLAAPGLGAEAACSAAQNTTRSGTHAGFGRIVFDWRDATDYEVQLTSGGLTVRFPGADCTPVVDRLPAPRNVNGIRPDDDSGGFRIETVPGARISHFRLRGRVIIDVADASARMVQNGPVIAQVSAEAPAHP